MVKIIERGAKAIVEGRDEGRLLACFVSAGSDEPEVLPALGIVLHEIVNCKETREIVALPLRRTFRVAITHPEEVCPLAKEAIPREVDVAFEAELIGKEAGHSLMKPERGAGKELIQIPVRVFMEEHLDVIALQALQRPHPDPSLCAVIEGIAKFHDLIMLLRELIVALIIGHDIDVRSTIQVDARLHLYLIDAGIQVLPQLERGFRRPAAAVDAHVAAFGDEGVFTVQAGSHQQNEQECKGKANYGNPHTLILPKLHPDSGDRLSTLQDVEVCRILFGDVAFGNLEDLDLMDV